MQIQELHFYLSDRCSFCLTVTELPSGQLSLCNLIRKLPSYFVTLTLQSSSPCGVMRLKPVSESGDISLGNACICKVSWSHLFECSLTNFLSRYSYPLRCHFAILSLSWESTYLWLYMADSILYNFPGLCQRGLHFWWIFHTGHPFWYETCLEMHTKKAPQIETCQNKTFNALCSLYFPYLIHCIQLLFVWSNSTPRVPQSVFWLTKIVDGEVNFTSLRQILPWRDSDRNSIT